MAIEVSLKPLVGAGKDSAWGAWAEYPRVPGATWYRIDLPIELTPLSGRGRCGRFLELDLYGDSIRQVDAYDMAMCAVYYDSKHRKHRNAVGEVVGEMLAGLGNDSIEAAMRIDYAEFERAWKSGSSRQRSRDEFVRWILSDIEATGLYVYEVGWDARTWFPEMHQRDVRDIAKEVTAALLSAGYIEMVHWDADAQSYVQGASDAEAAQILERDETWAQSSFELGVTATGSAELDRVLSDGPPYKPVSTG